MHEEAKPKFGLVSILSAQLWSASETAYVMWREVPAYWKAVMASPDHMTSEAYWGRMDVKVV